MQVNSARIAGWPTSLTAPENSGPTGIHFDPRLCKNCRGDNGDEAFAARKRDNYMTDLAEINYSSPQCGE
jgi:hypothetical protein